MAELTTENSHTEKTNPQTNNATPDAQSSNRLTVPDRHDLNRSSVMRLAPLASIGSLAAAYIAEFGARSTHAWCGDGGSGTISMKYVDRDRSKIQISLIPPTPPNTVPLSTSELIVIPDKRSAPLSGVISIAERDKMTGQMIKCEPAKAENFLRDLQYQLRAALPRADDRINLKGIAAILAATKAGKLIETSELGRISAEAICDPVGTMKGYTVTQIHNGQSIRMYFELWGERVGRVRNRNNTSWLTKTDPVRALAQAEPSKSN